MLWARPAAAETLPPWPQRTVRFLLPLGAGRGADIGARLRRPAVHAMGPAGRGREPARRRCHRRDRAFVSAHDDHLLLATPTSSFTAHPYLHDNLPYKSTDLLPIARVSNTIIALRCPRR